MVHQCQERFLAHRYQAIVREKEEFGAGAHPDRLALLTLGGPSWRALDRIATIQCLNCIITSAGCGSQMGSETGALGYNFRMHTSSDSHQLCTTCDVTQKWYSVECEPFTSAGRHA
jgi:hypothetical protein